jgi:protein-disulfide isomerase
MLKSLLVIASLAVFATGCTKKNKNQMATSSPFAFVYDSSLQGSEFVAQLGEDQITNSQLLSPSPALLELEERIHTLVLQKVYGQASSGDTITFAFDEPTAGLKKILGSKNNPEVTVTFDAKMKQGIAKLNDKTLSIDQVSEGDTLMSRLLQSRFEQRIRALEGLFARRKVLEASKAANITMEQFIKEKILFADVPVTEKDVDDFAKKNNLTEKDLTEELRAQIKDTIVSHNREAKVTKYVADNLIKNPIHVAFTKPTMTMANLKVDDTAPSLGEGPINVLFFSRFDCADCKSTASDISDFVASNRKYFKISYLFNFPVNSNEERMVAEASMCVKKQDTDFFWKFVEGFDAKAASSVEEAVNLAVKGSGADFELFRSCFLAREFKDQVESHLQSTKDFGFYKSPVVVLDGKIMETPQSQAFIDDALALKAEKGLGFNLFYNIKQFFK